MRILQLSAEIFPLLKTGGLADVAGALPAALHAQGVETRVLLPGFPAILGALQHRAAVDHFRTPWGEQGLVLYGELPAIRVGGQPLRAYVLDAPDLFDRPGNPYLDDKGRPYADNLRRFAALGWAAAHLGTDLDRHWRPDLVHGHDWHAGLAMAALHWQHRRHGLPRVPTVFTVHNLAYQGLFERREFADLGLPPEAFDIEGLEFYGQVSFMKAGLYYADRITTVSPTYAREIQTADQGCGLDGLLRTRQHRLSGILNGVDAAVWSPATDALLPARYDAADLGGKAACKAAFQAQVGLDVEAGAPLFTVVSRLTEQKGLHLVEAGIETLVAAGAQLFVQGTGEPGLEEAFTRASARWPGRVATFLGYDEALAHRVFAAGDVTLVPSRFEPCGLTQMYGLTYGCVPLVRGVGGLADTVVDADLATLEDGTATGVVFHDFSAGGFVHAVRCALALYRRPQDWARVQQRGMGQVLGWEKAAGEYVGVYRGLLG